VDLEALTKTLAGMEIASLLLEGGSTLNAAFLEASLVDRVVFFIAPKILGGARAPSPVGGDGRSLKEAFRVANLSVRTVGDDLLLEGDIEYEG
jgi:diaminohydroxyphosphoribosylaminopyrimidine deaminase/5-amino-6-(5-phosphoribosylamino)uracil reductase